MGERQSISENTSFGRNRVLKGKKASYYQRKYMAKIGYDSHIWLVQKDTPDMMQIVNKDTGEEKVIEKER